MGRTLGDSSVNSESIGRPGNAHVMLWVSCVSSADMRERSTGFGGLLTPRVPSLSTMKGDDIQSLVD